MSNVTTEVIFYKIDLVSSHQSTTANNLTYGTREIIVLRVPLQKMKILKSLNLREINIDPLI